MLKDLLKRMRISRGWTSADAAAKLSIAPQYLSRIENGRQTPSEALLHKMIQEYQVPPEDAALLLRSAGYSKGDDDVLYSHAGSQLPENQPEQLSTVKIVPPKDQNPILYTNFLFVSSDDFGIVIDAGQRVGATNEVQIVSRIGFSLEHAVKIQEVLGVHIDKLKKNIKS